MDETKKPEAKPEVKAAPKAAKALNLPDHEGPNADRIAQWAEMAKLPDPPVKLCKVPGCGYPLTQQTDLMKRATYDGAVIMACSWDPSHPQE